VTVPTVPHAAGGNTGGASTSITVTLPDTPASDELTIVVISGPGTATMTPPSGWSRVPRCGGHAGVGSGGNSRLWAYYCIGDPGDTTPTWTADTSRDYAWATMIIGGANLDVPFGSARLGGRAASSTGLAFIDIPGTPATDCMIVSLVSMSTSGSAYTSGTWTEDVEQANNGSTAWAYLVHNVTNYTGIDYDGNVSGPTWDWPGSGVSCVLMQVAILPATADYSIPKMLGSGMTATTGTTNGGPSQGVGPAGSGTVNYADYMVPGAMVLVGETSNDEAHTITTIRQQIGGYDFTVLGGDFPFDNTNGALQVSWYALGLDESNCWDFAELGVTDNYPKFTMSGSVTWITTWMILFGTAALPGGISGYSLQEFASGTGPDPAGFSVTEDDLIVLAMHTPSNPTVTNPAGYTAQQTLSNGGLNRTSVAYKTATATGTENPGAYTLSVAAISTFVAIIISAAGVPPPENITPPAVTGTPIPPNVLTSDDGTWDYSPTSYTYQWQISPTGIGSWSDITGETTDSYELTAGDEEQYVRCVVTATNASGSTAEPSNAVYVEEYPYVTTFSMIG